MIFFQKEVQLAPRTRGFHLVTKEILDALPELKRIAIGQFQVFICHTSASLTLNENADPTVRDDFEAHLNKMVPENAPYYSHTYEGPDDMSRPYQGFAHGEFGAASHHPRPTQYGNLARPLSLRTSEPWETQKIGDHRFWIRKPLSYL